MLTRDYLTLKLNRLKKPAEWAHDTDSLAFVFPSGGKGKFVSGSVAHSLCPGDVLVLNGSASGKLTVSDGSEVVFWCVSVQLEHLFPLFATDELCLLQDLQDRFKATRIYLAATPLAAECHKLITSAPPQFNLDHRSHVLRIVSAVLSAEMTDVRPQRTGFIRMEDHLRMVFDTLSIEELLTLSVGDLADRFSCSRRHLNRLFHHHFGFSVASLRMEMRLLKAASLLKDPDIKVINVAEQCGFNHLGLFNTCFKRRFGQSPGHWRKLPGPITPSFSPTLGSETKCPLRNNGLCPWNFNDGNGNGNGSNGCIGEDAAHSMTLDSNGSGRSARKSGKQQNGSRSRF